MTDAEYRPKEFDSQTAFDQTVDMIKRINGGGEEKLPWDELRIELQQKMAFFPFGEHYLNDGSGYLRGRFLNGKEFSDVNELLARPAKDVTSYGRCNKRKQTILYASTDKLDTVFSELNLQIGDRVQIIWIRKKKGAVVKCARVGEIDNLRRGIRPHKIFGDDSGNALEELLDKFSDVERLRLRYLDAFITDRFRRKKINPHDYKITSAFTNNVLLDFNDEYQALYYPSVQNLGGMNVVMDPKVYEASFEPVTSTVYEIAENLGYGFYGHHVIKESLPIVGDQIQWDRNFKPDKI